MKIRYLKKKNPDIKHLDKLHCTVPQDRGTQQVESNMDPSPKCNLISTVIKYLSIFYVDDFKFNAPRKKISCSFLLNVYVNEAWANLIYVVQSQIAIMVTSLSQSGSLSTCLHQKNPCLCLVLKCLDQVDKDSRDTLPFLPLAIMRLRDIQLTTCVHISLLHTLHPREGQRSLGTLMLVIKHATYLHYFLVLQPRTSVLCSIFLSIGKLSQKHLPPSRIND